MPSLFNKSSTEKQKRLKLVDSARRYPNINESRNIIPIEKRYKQQNPKSEVYVKVENLTKPHSPIQIEESTLRIPLSRRTKSFRKGGKKNNSRKARRSMKSRK